MTRTQTTFTAVIRPPDPGDHVNSDFWIYTVLEETRTAPGNEYEKCVKTVREAVSGTLGGAHLHIADAERIATVTLRDAGWIQVGAWEKGWRLVNGVTQEPSGSYEAAVIPQSEDS